MKDLHLYIGNTEVEFATPPEILYTYQEDDLNNPTIVKNSFSKTVTIEGTPTNNKIFGHYYNVQRVQGGGSDNAGVSFNASRKAPFTLYLGSDIYEQGYVKLDNVKTTKRAITYDVTLYGGLGDFFYNLDTNDNGDTLKLSDLKYTSSGDSEFDFTINKDTVKQAWDALENNTEGKWQYINFMTANNGYPDDFDTDKVLINTSGTSLQKSIYTDKTYSTKDGFVLGELPSKMTEAEIRDMRSYLQRPCIRMKEIVNACCKPENNGGYTVDLDTDFFNSNNPYWEKTWLTLPMSSTLEYSNDEQILEGATLVTGTTTGSTEGMMYQDLSFNLGNWSTSVPSYISVSAKILANTSYYNTSYMWFWNWNGDSYHSGWACFGSLFVQLIAMNGNDVVGASNVYNLTTPIRHNGNLYYGHNGKYDQGYSPYMGKTIYNILGKFGSDGFRKETSAGVFENTAATFNFYISGLNSCITGLKFVYYWGSNGDKRARFGKNRLINTTYSDGWISYSYGTSEVLNYAHNANLISTNVRAVIGDSLGRTGTKISKNILLNTESSPCDYLLSYCKMFGLYFMKDIDSNVIHIMTRKSFYDRSEVANLDNLIDKSKEISITPLTFDTKWYQFSQEMDETAYYKNYLSSKGVQYGSKILNTGYEFNSEKKELLEDNCIRSGIEGIEKSKYFTQYNNDNVLRPWFGMGLKYNLYNGNDTHEINITTNGGTPVGINEGSGMKYYDAYPKLQFHDSDNKATDGKNVLVFFSGFKNVVSGRTNALSYYLTDDTTWQTLLNDGTPCWLFTPQEYKGTERIAYKLSKIPVFERYLTNANSGKVNKSLDFGTAQELFVPDYNITDNANIYSNFWKTYLEDLYDVNTKVLTCYAKVEGKPSQNWLRRFYWFDNAIWRLNKIVDWNVSSYDTTKMEFVKVQDLSDYTTITQSSANTISISSNNYNIPYEGGSATLSINVTNGASWRIFSQTSGVTFSRTTGAGDGTVTATFGANTTNSMVYYYINASTEGGATTKITVSQENSGYTNVSTNSPFIFVDASDGIYEVEFDWFNQGDNYITSAVFDTGSTFASISIDTLTKRSENKAIITLGSNTGTTTKNNTITFSTSDGKYSVTSKVRQLPQLSQFAGDGDSKTLKVEDVTDLEFTNVPYWLDISQSGDEYTFNAKTNLYDSTQASDMGVKMGNTEIKMAVEQGIYDNDIFIATRINGTGDISPSGDTIYIQVESNKLPWTASSVSSWVHLSKNNDILTVSADTNDGEWRKAEIIFTDNNSNTIVYTVPQDGKSGGGISSAVSPSVVYFLSDGGTQYVSVNLKTSWTSTQSGSFFSRNITRGGGFAIMGITCGSNTGDTLNGSITISDGTNQYTVTVIQLGQQTQRSLSASPATQNVSYTGGSCTVNLTYEGRAGDDVIVIASGLTYGKASWSGDNGTIIFNVPVNSELSTKTYNITFNSEANSASTIITQDAFVESASSNPDSFTISASSGIYESQITSNCEWSATTTDDWITLNKSGNTLYITVAENPLTESRLGAVTIRSIRTSSSLDMISITQAYEERLSISPTSLTFTESGGTATFTITSNTNWTIE